MFDIISSIMKSKKQTKVQERLSLQTIRNVIVAIALWFVFWLLSQYLFFGEWPSWLASFMQDTSAEQQFIYLTLWISLVAIIGVTIWHKTFRDYSFLNLSGRTYLAYIVPIALLIWLLLQPLHFGVSAPIYATGAIVSVFWQDLLTFGFLYTYLDSQVNSKLATVITAAVFFAGHLFTTLTLPELIAYGLGFLVFAYLRYKTQSIYLTNVLHLSFILLPM